MNHTSLCTEHIQPYEELSRYPTKSSIYITHKNCIEESYLAKLLYFCITKTQIHTNNIVISVYHAHSAARVLRRRAARMQLALEKLFHKK